MEAETSIINQPTTFAGETAIQFSRWLYPKNRLTVFPVLFLSIIFHVLLFLTHYLVHSTGKSNTNATSISTSSSPVHIKFAPTTKSKLPTIVPNTRYKTSKNIKQNVLTDKDINSKSPTKALKIPNYFTKTPSFVKETPLTSIEKTKSKQENQTNLNSFLPNSNQKFIDSMRENGESSTEINGDAGDIPASNSDDPYKPRNGPQIQQRYSVKNLSLVQFSQEFRNRFGAIWNLKERIISPYSQLRPGNVVYYKVDISPDGSLVKYENLSKKKFPQKKFDDIDLIFKEVIKQVLPMNVPGKLFENKIISNVVAIQVVDTHNPVIYSFY